MNPNSLKNLKPAKKGEVRNPLGARAHDQARKALKKFTGKKFAHIIELAVKSNLEGLKKHAENPKTSAIEVGVCTALMKAIKNGDWGTLNAIVERIVGKIPDRLNVHNTGGVSVVVALPPNGREAKKPDAGKN